MALFHSLTTLKHRDILVFRVIADNSNTIGSKCCGQKEQDRLRWGKHTRVWTCGHLRPTENNKTLGKTCPLCMSSVVYIAEYWHICWHFSSRGSYLLQALAIHPLVKRVRLTQSRKQMQLQLKTVRKTLQFLCEGTERVLIPLQSFPMKASLLLGLISVLCRIVIALLSKLCKLRRNCP